MMKLIPFNGTRFLNLLRKEILENWKPFLLRMLVVYGLLSLVLVWSAYFYYNPYDEVETIEQQLHVSAVQWLVTGFFLFGFLSASRMMESMNTKARRIYTLMIPATMLEKFVVRWLLYAVISLLAYLLAFTLADFTRSVIYWAAYLPEFPRIGLLPISDYLVAGKYSWALFSNLDGCLLAVFFFLFFQSLFALGSCLWPRMPLQKTFAAILLLFVSYALFAVLLAHVLLDGRYVTLTDYWEAWLDSADHPFSVLEMFVLASGTLFNWVIAYFRFKESEIIHRW